MPLSREQVRRSYKEAMTSSFQQVSGRSCAFYTVDFQEQFTKRFRDFYNIKIDA